MFLIVLAAPHLENTYLVMPALFQHSGRHRGAVQHGRCKRGSHQDVCIAARGLANKEIASELKLSLRTIEGHISRILDKKNLSNRVELALHVRGRKQNE